MSITDVLPAPVRARAPLARRSAAALMQTGLAVFGAAAVAYLVANGLWYVATALLISYPAFVLLTRRPMLASVGWLVLTPLVVETSSASIRGVFWLVHRGLPVAALAIVVLGAVTRTSPRRLGRLGLPEVLMAGYVVATLLSIGYTSSDAVATAYQFYDRMIAPMSLYLLVRLLEPDEREVRSLVPAVAFLLVTQATFGALQWVAPGTLPSEWLGKLGSRTVGSLRSPDVYGSTMVFAALFLLHAGAKATKSSTRTWFVLGFVLALVMAFLTFSRASWVAAAVAVAGTLFVYRGFVKQLLAVAVPVLVVLLASGVMADQVEFARQRLQSEESRYSALSRLPVVYASIRMFEERPALGFGYERFDEFDRQYQRRVGNLVVPDDKDLSSHNLYLTTLAEQGITGFVLFVGPAAVWLIRTRLRRRDLPTSGFLDRRLVIALWLVLAGHVIVNNFTRMQSPFGFGIWWLTLALIGTIVDRASRPAPAHREAAGR